MKKNPGKNNLDIYECTIEDFFSISTAAKICFWKWDVKSDELFFSENISQLFGYTNDFFQNYKSFFSIIHPDDKKSIQQQIKQLDKKTSSEYEQTYRVKTKNNSFVFVREIGLVIKRDEKGSPLLICGVLIDCSQQKNNEFVLKQSEEKFKLLFENAPDAIYLNDLKGVFIDANKQAERILGYKKKDLIGKSFRQSNLLSSKDIPRALKLLSLNAMGKSSAPDVFSLRRFDGSFCEVEISTFPLKVEGKTVVLGLARDISARKKEQRKFKQYITHSPTPVFITDIQGNYTFVNPSACHLVGYSENKLLSMNIAQIAHPDEADETLKSFPKLLDGKHVREEICLCHKSGKKIYVILDAVMLDNQNIIGFCTDITDRKKAEDEVRKLSHVVEQSPVCIAITNLSGTIVYVNDMFSKVTGYSFKEVVGKNPRILKSGEISKTQYAELWKLISSGRQWRGEFHNKKKNGSLYWEFATISPIKNKHGAIINYVKVAEDITKRKQTEEKIIESERLFRGLFDNTHDLIQSVDEKGNFIYVNPSWLKVLGYSKKDLSALNLFDVIKKDEHGHCMQIFKKVCSGESQVNVKTIFIDKNGKEVAVEGNVNSQFKDGVFVATQGIFRDVTDRNFAEQALKQSEKKYRNLVDHINDLIYCIEGFEKPFIATSLCL
jgi:PAS domain S-box-containing protein